MTSRLGQSDIFPRGNGQTSRRFDRRIGKALLVYDMRQGESTASACAGPIRVLRLITGLNIGGPTLHVAYLARGLESRGYRTMLGAGALARGETRCRS